MHRLAALLTSLALASPAVAAEAPPALRSEARALFESIIAMDTSVTRHDVPAMAEFLAAKFRAAGFPASDIHIVPFHDTASLVVRYRGDGSGGRPVALLAHMDVVTAKRSDWQRDPFRLTEEAGYFYGRGTADVKQEVALLSATFLHLKAEGFVPTRDLILAFSGDEESAQDNTVDLVDNHHELIDAEYALNGDGGGGVFDEATGKPTIYYVQGAEKSAATYLLTTRNAGGHSSQPRADNAIYDLADAVKAVQRLTFPIQWSDWTISDLKASGAVTPGPLGAALRRFAAKPGDRAAAREIERSPAFVGKIRTTCVATQIEGGHAENALPQSAVATINCRIFPGTSATTVQQALQAAVGPRVEIAMRYTPLVSDASPLRPDVMAAVEKALNASTPGATIVPTMAVYMTDGAVFRRGGIPTYGVDSTFIKRSDEFRHGLNERIQVSAFYAGLPYWDTLIRAIASKP